MSEVKDFSAFKYVFKCAHCGEDFGAVNTQKKYCGRNCKTYANNLRNPVKAKENQRRTDKKRSQNPERREKRKEYSRVWSALNPEKRAEAQRRRRESNPEPGREKTRIRNRMLSESHAKLLLLESQGVYEAMALYELVKSGTVTIQQSTETSK
jgi:hypothetical protein